MKTFPAECKVVNYGGYTFAAYPYVEHLTNCRPDDEFIGRTQRVETYQGDALVRVEEVQHWYLGTGQFRFITTREVAA
ncbi:MAG: hypothetical protein ACO27L_05125 [Schleiferiaceae bacterium]